MDDEGQEIAQVEPKEIDEFENYLEEQLLLLRITQEERELQVMKTEAFFKELEQVR